MNIYTIRDNLKNTIAGKQALLDQYRKAQGPATGSEDIVTYAIVRFLETNLEELGNILADVEKCVAKEIEHSWRDNPDRMGGQYTQEEIDRADRWI